MSDIETRFAVHEAVCETRYEQIEKSLDRGDARMQRIELLLYGVIILVMLGPGTAAEFIKKFFG